MPAQIRVYVIATQGDEVPFLQGDGPSARRRTEYRMAYADEEKIQGIYGL